MLLLKPSNVPGRNKECAILTNLFPLYHKTLEESFSYELNLHVEIGRSLLDWMVLHRSGPYKICFSNMDLNMNCSFTTDCQCSVRLSYGYI